uniref:Uncharacterized protein n=1 Tax=Chromera velia CCMP2878 TaxID=1169474 RepID=A0A0K6S7D1_9ALVE|eukprot:Cvel_21418.t2-p1 / transcript=Cvel_21418.t2 / gene=Cvel_21418 / organism=Chromera_velia_CCMP2878 / gene_product=hypothetical protein / transcript_product=hypothetical protein / location=Cvel_scaffold2007:908-5732(+) / protein_length=147 / sequence_SO=supercontig / SO=protein_coding / is_pseudo=false
MSVNANLILAEATLSWPWIIRTHLVYAKLIPYKLWLNLYRADAKEQFEWWLAAQRGGHRVPPPLPVAELFFKAKELADDGDVNGAFNFLIEGLVKCPPVETFVQSISAPSLTTPEKKNSPFNSDGVVVASPLVEAPNWETRRRGRGW